MASASAVVPRAVAAGSRSFARPTHRRSGSTWRQFSGRGDRRRTTLRQAPQAISGLFGGRKKEPESEPEPEPAAAGPGDGGGEVMVFAPPYTVVAKCEGYDLRLYDVYNAVECDYDRRDEGLLQLSQYMDGLNESGDLFAETQPVLMRYEPGGRKAMQLYVRVRRNADGTAKPDCGTMPPLPSDPATRLEICGGKVVAVSQFSGYITPETAGEQRAKLVRALERDGVELAEEEKGGTFRCAQYGQIFQFDSRLNEVHLHIQL